MHNNEFTAELAKRAKLVDKALEEFLPGEDVYPQTIHKAMRYSVFAGGKRLRPLLVMAAAETVGGNPEKVLPTACALELLHTYSLIHDDLPAMDNDDYRRGKPTCHKAFGEAIAVLAGDALLTLAFEMIVKNADNGQSKTEDVLKVISEVSRGAGTLGMIGGQVVDMESAGKKISPETLKYIHSHKTGALFIASIRAGAILAGGSPEHIQALTVYAENFGLAFQITDDILDVEGDSSILGKTVGSDEKNQKSTYPFLFGMAEARKMADEAIAKSIEALEIFDSKADFLRNLARYLSERQY